MRILNICIFLLIMISVNSSCVSRAAFKYSKNEVALRKAVEANNSSAIRAICLGEEGDVGIGIDVSNFEAIKEHPIRQALAALADAVIAYGCYEGARYLEDEINEEDEVEETETTVIESPDGIPTTINVNGNNNNVSINVN